MPLTPADIRNKEFNTTRIRAGYDQEEVDEFLEHVEAELDGLLRDNEKLRARLGENSRGGQLPVRVLSPPAAVPDAIVHEAPWPPVPERLTQSPGNPPPGEAPLEAAARVLVLAQQEADKAIADARREAGEIISGARREVDDLLGTAQRQAGQITSEARTRAESLERDAHERHRQAMGSLVQQREDLERRIDDLQAFERDRRGRLKAYLTGVLQDLEDDGDGIPLRPGRAEAPSGISPPGVPPASPNGTEQLA
jgi:DivIVA domain-containing protein